MWPADASAVETAAQDVRPNTMIVAVDENLTVSTLDGEVLSENLALSTSPPLSRPPCPHCTSVTMRPQPRSTPSLLSTLWPTPSLLPTTSTLSMLRTSAMQTSAFSVSSTGVKPTAPPSAARTPSLTMTPKRIISPPCASTSKLLAMMTSSSSSRSSPTTPTSLPRSRLSLGSLA